MDYGINQIYVVYKVELYLSNIDYNIKINRHHTLKTININYLRIIFDEKWTKKDLLKP